MPDEWLGTVDTLPSGRVVVASPATGLWDSTSAWRVEEQVRIGTVEGTGPDLFRYIAGIQVDDQGRIWVLDRAAKQLRVFDPDGSHLWTLGREGAGPEEFADPIGLALSGDGQIWVADPGNARYAVFDTSGTYVGAHTRRIPGYVVPWQGAFDAENRLLEVANARIGAEIRRAVLRFNRDLQPVDTFVMPEFSSPVFELRDNEGLPVMSMDVPFTATLVWALDPERGFWSAINSDYIVHQQTFSGDTARSLSRVYQPVQVTSAERAEAIRRAEWITSRGGSIDLSKIPQSKPAFSRIDVAPDGHLWVSVTRPAGVQVAFDVFDPDGRYLGQVESRASFHPRIIFRGARIYGAARDSLDVEYVVSAIIVRPGQ
jgi:sugar lactone lactonase YvrE